MSDNIIQKSIYLKASPQQVWSFLTEPDKLALWFHRPSAPLLQGNVFEMHGSESGKRLIWGKVTVARAPEYLEYTFTVEPMGDSESLAQWELTPVAGGTRLSLVHRGLPQTAEAFSLLLSLDAGWEEHMGRMRSLLHESG
ncbi:SRPBCC family protein [Microbulbifer sp. S227A]|uniref:SRPBCC family protein n=1 Tax=Microbulbifer sp. S227A TaxID=3415131 RepID=UPI003C7DDD98